MISLYSCSWAKNVKPLDTSDRQQRLADAVLEESRGAPEYSRIMGLNSVRKLHGTMTPRWFATKVLRTLAKEFPDKTINDVTDEDILASMTQVAAQARKLQMKPEIKFDTVKVKDVPKAEDKFVKGEDKFDTLQQNLDPDTEFTFKEDAGENAIYVAKKGGLNFRITLGEHKGTKLKLKDITANDLVSLVVTDPSSMENVELPSLDDADPMHTTREEPIEDFPPGEEGDFSGPDPENIDSNGDIVDDEDEDLEDEEDEESTQFQKRPHVELVSAVETPQRENPVRKSPQEINRLLHANLHNRRKHIANIEHKHRIYY